MDGAVEGVVSYGVAPGKVILFGEHFVVSGNPAVAAAVKLRTTAYTKIRSDGCVSIGSRELGVNVTYADGESMIRSGGSKAESLNPLRLLVEEARRRFRKEEGVDIHIHSEIPMASGLGSSASAAVSTAASLLAAYRIPFDKGIVMELASGAERMVHGRPSGIDHTVITLGGILLYRLGGIFKPLPSPRFKLVVVNTRRFRSTGRLVAKAQEYLDGDPARRRRMLSEAERIVSGAVRSLSRGDLEALGGLMYRNHDLLRELGVSSRELDLIVEAAKDLKALGAKLTGAGGGGCAVVLPRRGSEMEISVQMRGLGFEPFIVDVDEEGAIAGTLDNRGEHPF
ncbi:MAG: mevalonate kinase [Candidatus Bathyarchaeia archaeon]